MEISVVSITNLLKRFPVGGDFFTALKQINLELQKGEFTGLVGPSGSGKTTLGLAILRMIPSTGDIWVRDDNLQTLSKKALKPHRKDLQIVFQDPYGSLSPRMTVSQIVGEGLRIHEPALSETEKDEKVLEAIIEVGLEAEMLERYPHEFSGGQRQRIGIARALVVKPKLIVCDEPVSALDVSIQAQVINLLMDLQQQLGLAYVFIAHDLAVIRHIAHRVGVMYL